MKIIDKNKDYYDFLMGVYGQDPKAVYDRRGSAILHKDRTPEPLRIRLEWKAYPFPKEHINTCRWRMTALI